MALEPAAAEDVVETPAEAPSEEPVAEAVEAPVAEAQATEEAPAEAAPEGEAEEAPAVPETPDAYDIALPEEIKLAGGEAIKFDEKDPMLNEFKAKAHDLGLTQEQFTDFLSFGANFLKANLDGISTVTQEQVQEQIAKLGKTPEQQEQRVQNLFSALTKRGDEQGATALMNEVRTVESFTFLEKLLEGANGMGGKRTPAINGTIKERPPIHERLFGQTSR